MFFQVPVGDGHARNAMALSQIDVIIRKAVQVQFVAVAEDGRNLDEMQVCFSGLIERAFQDLRDDAIAFEELRQGAISKMFVPAISSDEPSINTLLSPQIDGMIRQAIRLLVFSVAEDRRNLGKMQACFLRLVERAFEDLRDDAIAYEDLKNCE